MSLKQINILEKILFFVMGMVASATLFLYFFGDLWKFNDLNKIIASQNQKNYDAQTYNCVDFSKDAQNKLDKNNILSNVVVLRDQADPDKTHAVVSVLIDPQTGQFVDKNQYFYFGTYDDLKNKFGWAK